MFCKLLNTISRNHRITDKRLLSCRKALWLQVHKALWSNCKRTQSRKSTFFLCEIWTRGGGTYMSKSQYPHTGGVPLIWKKKSFNLLLVSFLHFFVLYLLPMSCSLTKRTMSAFVNRASAYVYFSDELRRYDDWLDVFLRLGVHGNWEKARIEVKIQPHITVCTTKINNWINRWMFEWVTE